MEHISNLLLTAPGQNRELAKQESTLPKNGDNALFAVALSGAKIANCDLENVKEALRYAMVKIGLRSQNWPSEEEKAILLDHVLRIYGGHTAAEIRLAFDMALEGKLAAEVNCYENFSCFYFSNIMNAYRKWALQEYDQLPKELPEIEYKEDMSRDAMLDWFNDTAKKIRAGQLLVDFVPLMLYEFMDGNGNISATPEEKYGYLQRAAEYRLEQLKTEYQKKPTPNNQWRVTTFSNHLNRGYFEGDEIDVVKSLAKKMLLYDTIINAPI